MLVFTYYTCGKLVALLEINVDKLLFWFSAISNPMTFPGKFHSEGGMPYLYAKRIRFSVLLLLITQMSVVLSMIFYE
jgi:hypothetical protein